MISSARLAAATGGAGFSWITVTCTEKAERKQREKEKNGRRGKEGKQTNKRKLKRERKRVGETEHPEMPAKRARRDCERGASYTVVHVAKANRIWSLDLARLALGGLVADG